MNSCNSHPGYHGNSSNNVKRVVSSALFSLLKYKVHRWVPNVEHCCFLFLEYFQLLNEKVINRLF